MAWIARGTKKRISDPLPGDALGSIFTNFAFNVLLKEFRDPSRFSVGWV